MTTLSPALTISADGARAVAASFTEAVPTSILQVAAGTATHGGTQNARTSLVVGCEDGTLYLLRLSGLSRNTNSSLHSVGKALEVSTTSSTSSGRRHTRGLASPRSQSPSPVKPSFSPFQVTKPRVVSSVSAAQAEAPKNYVDFDEEQEKMRNMVKRKGVKDKGVMDSLMPGVEKTFEKCSDTSAAHTFIEADSATLASTPLSPRSSTHSLSLPSSPATISRAMLSTSGESASWKLVCHTIPCERARLAPITRLIALEGYPLALCLHRSGEVGVYSTQDGMCQVSSSVDGGSFPLPAGAKSLSKLSLIWNWRGFHVLGSGKSFVVFACASPEATTSTIQPSEVEEGRTDETRVVVFDLEIERRDDPGATTLTKIGDWSFAGPVEGISVHKSTDGEIRLFRVNTSHHLIRQSVVVEDKSSRTTSPLPGISSSTNLPLPNPFKVLKGIKSSENLVEDPVSGNSTRIRLSDEIDMGLLPLRGQLRGFRLDDRQPLTTGYVWSQDEILLFDASSLSISSSGTLYLSNICDLVRHEDDQLTIRFADRAELHKLNASDPHISAHDMSSPRTVKSQVTQSYPLPSVDASAFVGSDELVYIWKKNERMRIESSQLTNSEKPNRVLWKARRLDKDKNTSVPRISTILPMELDELIIGYTDGVLEKSSLTSLLQRKARGSSGAVSDFPLSGAITAISTTIVERTSKTRVVAGADDGTIAILTFNSLRLLARWTVFLEPLKQVVTVSEGRLKGCILCISRDGSIALVALDGCQFLALVPASAAPLCSICLGEDNLLLSYADRRARLWDVRTREFWRSMSAEKADEMLKQGGWQEWLLGFPSHPNTSISAISTSDHLVDAGATIVLDLDSLLSIMVPGSLHNNSAASQGDTKADIPAKREYLRALLLSFLTCGLNDDIDRICQDRVGASKPFAVGLRRCDATTVYATDDSFRIWTISPDISALRAIAIVAFLHAMLPYEDNADYIHTLCAFYTASVAQCVGASFQSPSLSSLARVWLNARAPELRIAARQLFDGCMARLMDDQVISLVEDWLPDLPHVQDGREREPISSALALFICGSIAIEKYTLLPASALTDIAKSIALYLHDEHSPYRSLAIDLCSRGFVVWQQYVDAVEILQALFALATSGRKETNPQQSIGAQARTAVLLIASGNSPLFMTTVSMDILQPKSVQHRKSVMQLVIFLIHKKPLVLYSNLPRLVEAVVKSLDPNSTADRDAVLDSATEILGHLVETYPILDFHGPSQRLAIGTSEGAVVMYDLKTATRLYVLEGHKRRTTACAFSPDGRRLVTLSLEEHTVLVWKVGSSFTSFFMPGVPPRQGRGGSEPYKTYDFNIGDEGNMTLAATLDFVKFDWPSDRSVRIHIKGAILTFST